MKPFTKPRPSFEPWKDSSGVFESILVRQKKIFRFEEHINRLFASAKALRQKVPQDKEALKKTILQKTRESGLEDAYLRVGIAPNNTPVIIVKKLTPHPKSIYVKGVRIGVIPTRKAHPETTNPRIKNQNFLCGVLAKIEATQRNLFEGLMCGSQGFVAEGTISNIFIVRDGILATPPTTDILKGITRGVTIEIARRAGIEIWEQPFTGYDIYTADEALLTYTSAGIVPAVEIDGRRVGNGHPGPLTKKLIRLYEATFQKEATPV